MSRKIVILYGSQTGTAQDISENIWRESKRFYFAGGVKAMDDYEVRNLIEEEIAIFVCSTTGQGDEPDNMKNFWKFLLRKSLPTDSLENLNFGVIGLGDSSYQKFNFVAKRLHKRLMQLGAKPILPAGLCDDQHDLGIGAVLFPWVKDFWQKLNELKPLSVGVNPHEESPRATRWIAKKCQTIADVDVNQDIFGDFDETPVDGFAEVLENTRTTSSDHFQDVRLISFCRCNLTWNVGDVAYVRPRNSSENVEKLFEIFDEHQLGFNASDCVMLDQIDDDKNASWFRYGRLSVDSDDQNFNKKCDIDDDDDDVLVEYKVDTKCCDKINSNGGSQCLDSNGNQVNDKNQNKNNDNVECIDCVGVKIDSQMKGTISEGNSIHQFDENLMKKLQTMALADYDESLTCNVCDRAFRCQKQLDSHQQKKRHFGCSECDTLFPSLMLLEHHKEEYEHWSDTEDYPQPCCRRNRREDFDFSDSEGFTSDAESEDLERLL